MSTWLIIAAVATDFIIGDPVYSFHPVRLIGRLALYLETIFRRILTGKKTAGIITAVLTLLIPGFLTYLITATILKLSPVAGFITGTFFVYSSIACKDMIVHSKEIFFQLSNNNLILARAKTAMIVGRDTVHMNEKEIIRATLESIAENTVDGILAPLFYAALGSLLAGVTGAACFAILYRAVNTLDSSFGYRNEEYRDFGMASARIDDVCNFIPSRLSIFIISISALFTGLNWKKSFHIALRDHANHASPNSGYSEGAYAGALEVQFGGETLYEGEIIQRPLLGDPDTPYSIDKINLACQLLFNTTLFFTILVTGILFLYSF